MLRAAGISKRFGATQALRHVDLALERGEIRALVGENGAGKSTLIKIITGAVPPDAGTIEVGVNAVRFSSPAEAQHQGIAAVYQEVNLLLYRNAAENIFLGREPLRWGQLDKSRMHSEARAVLAELEASIDTHVPLQELSIARRQLVAIARGVSLQANLLIFDEPTSSLTESESATLFRVIRKLQSRGTAILYVSHRLDELYELCVTVTVLRDGQLVWTKQISDLTRKDLIEAMLGRPREQRDGRQESAARDQGNELLTAEDLASGNRVRDVSLRVGPGQVLGIAGLLGSGRTETLRALSGVDRASAGTMSLQSEPYTPTTPAHAIRSGVTLLPEDRKGQGIVPDLSIRENITLAALPAMSRFGIVSRAAQAKVVDRFMAKLRIRAANPEQKVRELSGGNQQKVLLARLLCCDPRLLLLDEPTRGIDIGAKDDVHTLMREQAAQGKAVIMVSSEIEELLDNCERVTVLREGRSVAELSGEALTRDGVVHAMAQDAPPEPA